jgi:hypothetical protein
MKGVQAYSTIGIILDAMDRLLILILLKMNSTKKKFLFFGYCYRQKIMMGSLLEKKRRAFITNDHQFNSYYSNRTRNTRVDGMIYKLYY